VYAFLRGNKVLARATEGGELASEGGRVEIRYKPSDGRKYAARADNLTVVSGQVLPDDHCGPATSVADAKSAAAKGQDAAAKAPGQAAEAGAGTPSPAAKRVARATKKPAAATESHAHHEAAAPDGAIHVYADGACSGNPGPAGIGVVVLDEESRVELSEYIGQGTNNIAELTAILRALGETADSERPLVIHTDSSYSIGVLQKGWKAKANQDLVAELRELLKRRKGTRLVYVPGHAGVRWNERADSLARDAVAYRKTNRKVVRATPAAP
jgi:ribonuclease HI